MFVKNKGQKEWPVTKIIVDQRRVKESKVFCLLTFTLQKIDVSEETLRLR